MIIRMQTDTPFGHQMRIVQNAPNVYVIEVKFNERHQWESIWTSLTYTDAMIAMYKYFIGVV